MIDKKVAEKKKVALISVFAAVFLTGSKLLIGIVTGSLGILSEAVHSGLDLIAAVITYFAVRVSDKPGDEDHHFGHGKVENLSALIETILLFITCIWIIYEAINRLVTGHVMIDITIWSYLVVVSSIIIDYSRSRALSKAAKKYRSQALEADALHFSTDIWSSFVVLTGLIVANFGFYFADAISALGVAIIVLSVCYKLGKKAIDVLLDRAPVAATRMIIEILKNNPDVHYFHDVKVRESGPQLFAELTIHVSSKLNIEEAHSISEIIENRIRETFKAVQINIHLEPDSQH